jgi:hypothetical protein
MLNARFFSIAGIVLAAVTGSVLFFLITNFGVWLTDGLYPRTLDGLVICYAAAIPFFRHTLAGDAVYTIVLFGGFMLMQRYFTMLREEPAAVMVRI